MSEEIKAELVAGLSQYMAERPRSLQKEIGCSEVGTPCHRKLAYTLAQTPKVNDDSAKWLPQIGTWAHSGMEEFLHWQNARLGRERYLIEQSIEIPLPPDGKQKLLGHNDFTDLDRNLCGDWKVVGATTLKAAKAGLVSDTYKIQIQLYALGLWLQGIEIEHVAIIFLPRNSISHRDMVTVVADYDESIAVAAIDRLAATKTALGLFGDKTFQTLATADDYCSGCGWFQMNSPNIARACPGSDALQKSLSIDSILSPAKR